MTLMIAVTAGSTDFQSAIAVALKCKTVLEQYGIRNVECEIRESGLESLVGKDEPSPVTDGAS